ncbi:DUF3592 domain-containing protein [Roseomonas sp. CAU 1739]|uniref:DUF3592 domain-containing protein n=1 Tax=Roseomonas sp. CAU 1739 TaxID=3140364 RepID=UPI00325A54DD
MSNRLGGPEGRTGEGIPATPDPWNGFAAGWAMTALQVAGVVITAFMAWWNATLIRSARRQRRWLRAEARILQETRWTRRCRFRFTAANGDEVTASCGIDPDGVRPVPGETLAVIYDPDCPARCEAAMTQGTIAGLRLMGFAAMAGGIALLVWG